MSSSNSRPMYTSTSTTITATTTTSPDTCSTTTLSSIIKNHKTTISTMTTRRHYALALCLTVALVALLLSMIVSVECHIKRTQYHEQGVHGPKSYKFGYTSGDEKNPQERHEVSDGHGHVKGWYSFVDASGKHQVVHYEAHPKYGFKVYNHKSKAHNNGKRHYGS